jgi:integrase
MTATMVESANPMTHRTDPLMLCSFSEIRKAGLPHVRLHDLQHTHATLMLRAGVHPKVVSERLGHAGIGITLDTYSHVLPGLQEAAAERFDKMLETSMPGTESRRDVSKMLVEGEETDSRPCRARTCDTLIKSQVLCQLS